MNYRVALSQIQSNNRLVTTAISNVEFYVLWITAIHHTAERHPVNSLMALSTQTV
jgi:hypothetical protein